MDKKLIQDCTDYLVVVGSHAYGTAKPTSDIDIRGIATPPPEYFLCFDKHFEQYDATHCVQDYPFRKEVQKYALDNKIECNPTDDVDSCIFDIRKFFTLASQCNPNVIELLFVDNNEILISSKVGDALRSNRNVFLSARAKFTYSGYAYSQLHRINLHRKYLLRPMDHKPERFEYGLGPTSLVSADQRDAAEKLIDDRVRDWLFFDAEIDKTVLSLAHDRLRAFLTNLWASRDLLVDLADENKLIDAARLAAMNTVGFDKNYIAIVQAEKKYRSALREWNQFQDWKINRNAQRADLEAKFLYDTKHASHLVRLLLGCKEILTEGTVRVRRPDAQLLLDIRNGAWTYEQLIEFTDKMEAEIGIIYESEKYVVPKIPDIPFLSGLCYKLISE